MISLFLLCFVGFGKINFYVFLYSYVLFIYFSLKFVLDQTY